MKIAINGFGRIGRLAVRNILQKTNLELVAVNDLADTAMMMHLLKYDSTHGRFPYTLQQDQEDIVIEGKHVRVLTEKDPKKLPWRELGVDIVLECTGIFTSYEAAHQHIEAGAKKVIISAPSKGDTPVKNIVMGINENTLTAEDIIVSNASCTTNCYAPIVYVLEQNIGIEHGYMSTVHAYTQDQHLQDTPHKSDFRRARAAAQNITPTTTNAAKAIEKVMPILKGKLSSIAFRVPVTDGSLIDATFLLKRETTVAELHTLFQLYAAQHPSILEFCTDPIVSTDIIGNTHSSILDSLLTECTGRYVKIISWYDNEMGYATRLGDLLDHVQALSH